MIDFGQPFNFAQHLFELNQDRADKIAYTDDQGTLSYAQLQEQARRLAHGLTAAGIHREERVMLVMHDMLGVYTRKPAKFVKNFLTDEHNETKDITGAFNAYHQAVKDRTFPTPAHSF